MTAHGRNLRACFCFVSACPLQENIKAGAAPNERRSVSSMIMCCKGSQSWGHGGQLPPSPNQLHRCCLKEPVNHACAATATTCHFIICLERCGERLDWVHSRLYIEACASLTGRSGEAAASHEAQCNAGVGRQQDCGAAALRLSAPASHSSRERQRGTLQKKTTTGEAHPSARTAQLRGAACCRS